MVNINWHVVAAIFGATGVALGAYGSHGFKPANPKYTEVFKTANPYHLLHGGFLVALAPTTR